MTEPIERGTRLVVADMAGTTVVDDGLVVRAFREAFAAIGVEPTTEQQELVRATMGRSKIEVFTELLGDAARAARANQAFEAACSAHIDAGEVIAVAGVEEVFARLRSAGIAVWLTTGFSAATQDHLVERLGWHDLVDGWLSPSSQWRGRPHPDLVWVAALRAQVDDIRAVAVVGDTANDLESGWRAGAGVLVGVLTGAHDRPTLERAPHTAILASIRELPGLLRPA
jgi:phosphonatase-like hydrolase